MEETVGVYIVQIRLLKMKFGGINRRHGVTGFYQDISGKAFIYTDRIELAQ
jgi:hypothetical protein